MSEVKAVKATSPVGNGQWFKLVKPDAKFKKYQVDLILEDSPELRNLINQMEEMIQEQMTLTKKEAAEKYAKDKSKPLVVPQVSDTNPIMPVLDSEGKDTGKFIMKFRDGSEGKKKDGTLYTKAPPAIFNAAAKPYSKSELETLKVPNGSTMKIAFEMKPYYVAGTKTVGVSLKPKAAMLIKLEQVSQASDFGFSASEFSEQDDSDQSEFESTVESESDADSDF